MITTHYMDEAEQLCDRLVVMDKGVIVAEGSPLDLIREHSTREVAELRFGVGGSTTRWRRRSPTSATGSRCCPTGCWSTPTTARRSIAKVHERGLEPVAVLVRRSTLEDVFLRLTGRTLVD